MSLFTRRTASITTADQLIPSRSGRSVGTPVVTNDSAMRVSAVWACLRLRGDLLSSLPLDTYRKVQGIQFEVPKPPVLVDPGGSKVDMAEWLYSSQVDLDRAGNSVGLITARDGLGLPARIDLQLIDTVSMRIKNGEIAQFRIGGKGYEPREVWHEKQYTIAGLPIGLSPVMYAALTLGEYQSIQEFAVDWFGSGAIPIAELKNVAKTINPVEAAKAKARFRASVSSGDIFVHGADWEYKPIQTVANQTDWIEAKQFNVVEIARFFGCPVDMIDGAVSGQSVTYASISQRNLQFLIMNLGPAIRRREGALSKLLPAPRFVKLNGDALLRMDPQTRATVLAGQIVSRQLAPSEARALENRMPFTDDQLAEFDRLFGAPRADPTQKQPTGAPA